MASNGNSLIVPPESRELEVSIFGPGYGECIVLHLGGGTWAVVDSCLDPISNQPVALHYLSSLGINAAKAVLLVVATHWHDDHMQGLGRVFKSTVNARFSCSAALRPPEITTLLATWAGTRFLSGGSGIDELHEILTEVRNRKDGSRYPAPKLAIEGKCLWPGPGDSNPLQTFVRCLSPSDAGVVATCARQSKLVGRSKKVRRRLPNLDENEASVVLSIESGGHRILLGADLEVRCDRALGWLAIVDAHGELQPKHDAFKVPHHGSPTGHHQEIWDKLTTDQAVAVTTPFISGDVLLPSVSDCRRILKHTKKAYLTAPPTPTKFKDTNKAVEKTVEEATRWVRLVPGKFGHLRLRKLHEALPEDPWRVELFGSAVSVSDYLQLRS